MHNTAQKTLISNGEIFHKFENSRPPTPPLAPPLNSASPMTEWGDLNPIRHDANDKNTN